MPDIRYVCLSDTHFGAANSLLTNLKNHSDEIDYLKPSPVLEKLVECLRHLIDQNNDKTKKPTLVLNGDILELALADDHDAAMTFERFIDLIMDYDREMFAQIIYSPGNHDHHLWETARESQYVDFISSKEPAKVPGEFQFRFPWGSELKTPWHTTHMFDDPARAYFLTALIQRRSNLTEYDHRDGLSQFRPAQRRPEALRRLSSRPFRRTHVHFDEHLENHAFPRQPGSYRNLESGSRELRLD